jgi:hypothetical protein
VRASRWLAPLVALVVLVGACSDDGDDRAGPARSSQPAPSSTTTPAAPTAPPDNAACALVTDTDLEALFDDTPSQGGSASGSNEDTVCEWKAGSQSFEFRLHEGSSLTTSNTSSASVNISVQRGRGGRIYAFTYLSDGGDLDTKRAAVNALADSVIARAEQGE